MKEFDHQIKEARRAATAALTLEEKLTGQKQIKAIASVAQPENVCQSSYQIPRIRGI
jgi:adenine-specific DNA-methyltransferase